ncbi:MAG: hypothetical protein HY22_01210 [[Candidatus Thermochlorobacteriaceae] bacterium GBChlB]|nr:MAG: hypothetical protein HY22_01210 [[Candidatus Thermochlorobacteriaceae] bacterium GBChlB]
MLCVPYAFAQTGLSFLNIGATAREQSMANTGTASAEGAASNYYNAARLNAGEKSSVMFSQNLWILDTQSSFAGANFNFGKSAVGISLTWFTVSDIPIRGNAPTTDPLGVFTSQNVAAAVSYSRSITDNLALALTGKLLYEKIFVDDALGAAVDVSASFKATKELALAATVQNLGGMSALAAQSSRLPTAVRLGGAYALGFSSLESTLLLEANVVSIFSDQTNINLGTEFQFRELLFIRVGYSIGNTSRNFSAGAGIAYSGFKFDYAFVPFSNQLGTANILTLQFHY